MSITISDKAAEEIKRILEEQSKPDSDGNSLPDKMYLRLGVKGGGCSGFNYTLDLTDHVEEDDEVFQQKGLDVVCDAKSYIYLAGVTVDFREGLMGRGFVFDNPNATGTCGCGSSFSA